MYQATSYIENHSTSGERPGAHPPPSTTFFTASNVNNTTGRLIPGGSGADAVATMYNVTTAGVTVTVSTPSLTFTKPASGADTQKEGTCSFLVHNIPTERPYFDLEMSFLRTAGVAKTVHVRLGVLKLESGTPTMHYFIGTVDVPAACPVVTTQLVTWDAGEPIQTSSDIRLLPNFFDVETSYATPPSTQPVFLALTTDDAMDEKVHILSFRFTFY